MASFFPGITLIWPQLGGQLGFGFYSSDLNTTSFNRWLFTQVIRNVLSELP